MTQVVDEARREEKRDTSEDPAELAAPFDRSRREREEHGRDEAGEDPHPAERRRRPLVPALSGGRRDEARAERGAEESPENRERDG